MACRRASRRFSAFSPMWIWQRHALSDELQPAAQEQKFELFFDLLFAYGRLIRTAATGEGTPADLIAAKRLGQGSKLRPSPICGKHWRAKRRTPPRSISIASRSSSTPCPGSRRQRRLTLSTRPSEGVNCGQQRNFEDGQRGRQNSTLRQRSPTPMECPTSGTPMEPSRRMPSHGSSGSTARMCSSSPARTSTA